jgi:hypothetical protein
LPATTFSLTVCAACTQPNSGLQHNSLHLANYLNQFSFFSVLFSGSGDSQGDFRHAAGAPVFCHTAFSARRVCLRRSALAAACAIGCRHEAIPHPCPAVLQCSRSRQTCRPSHSTAGAPLLSFSPTAATQCSIYIITKHKALN